MIKEAILLFSLVGFVDLEAEALAAQQRTSTTSGTSLTTPQGSDRGIRTRTSTRRRASSSSGTIAPTPVAPQGTIAAPGAPVESAAPGTNRNPIINNGVNPDGTPRNGAIGNGNSVQPNTTISNGTYSNPSGSGQNSNTGDGTNTISTPNGGLNGNGTTTPASSNSAR
jgi:hypothetical protein